MRTWAARRRLAQRRPFPPANPLSRRRLSLAPRLPEAPALGFPPPEGASGGLLAPRGPCSVPGYGALGNRPPQPGAAGWRESAPAPRPRASAGLGGAAMAASQRAATPAAARLQSPGDSSPGAQAAQSQREDPSEAATAAAAALRDEEDGEEAAPRAQARVMQGRPRAAAGCAPGAGWRAVRVPLGERRPRGREARRPAQPPPPVGPVRTFSAPPR